ncbi:MAG: hypothetical protein GY832_10460 [Chloroflexi bacterium]|nr:hypothetical protein [Chloroflexota bacterium]
MTDDLLKQGVAALKEGQQEKARILLTQVLEHDQHNEMGWLWMSGVVDTDAERRICLENVLAINPNNGIAKRGLEGLGASQMTSPFTTVQPLAPNVRKATTLEEQSIQLLVSTSEPDVPDKVEHETSEDQEEDEQAPPPKRKTRQRSGLIMGMVAGLLGIMCIAVVGIWWLITNGPLSLDPVPTLIPTVDVGQTSTSTNTDLTPTSDAALPSTQTSHPTDAPPTLFSTRTPIPTKTPMLTWTPSLTPTATMTTTATPTPTPAMTLPPTWTPHPTITPITGMTSPPTWTPPPSRTPAPTITSPPTWTPPPTITSGPIITLPPTWTPAYHTRTPTLTPNPTLTGTLVITGTPGSE